MVFGQYLRLYLAASAGGSKCRVCVSVWASCVLQFCDSNGITAIQYVEDADLHLLCTLTGVQPVTAVDECFDVFSSGMCASSAVLSALCCDLRV